MALTQAQIAALEEVRARLAGTEDDEQSRIRRQWQALDAVRPQVPEAPTPTDDVGFVEGLGNAVMQGLSSLRSIPDAMQAEEFAALADARAAQDARGAERARTGEQPGLLERIATYRPSWAAPLESSDELRGLAADNAQAVARRSVEAQQNYPMTQAGSQKVQELSEADGFIDGLGIALSDPLATASGVAQVAAQQIPTIVGAGLATAVTKNPTVGMAAFAGSGYAQERFGQLVPEASKEGYNLLDDRGALAAVSDTKFMQDQASRGQTRGAIIGAVDLLTAGLASKAPLTLRSVGTQTGIQVAGGGGGEAAAQLATDGEIQAGEVIIEALAEGVSAPVDVAAFALSRPNSQGSDINTQEAQLRAEEDAQLEAQALAEEQAAGLQAQAEAETTARIRREAAATFTPRREFAAGRQKVINDQLQADIRTPETELGKAFEANLNEKGVFDPADVEAEAKAFIKGYQKETKAATDAQITEEYIAALDIHAEAVARGEVPTPQATQEKAVETPVRDMNLPPVPSGHVRMYHGGDAPNSGGTRWFTSSVDYVEKYGSGRGVDTGYVDVPRSNPVFDTDPTLTNQSVDQGFTVNAEFDPADFGGVKSARNTTEEKGAETQVATPAKKPTKKEQLRADAVEKLGEDFEQNHPELSQLLSDGKGIYSRGKNKKSRFESMLSKAVAEQNAEAQPATPLAEQAPTVAEQAPTPAAQENTATPPVIAKEQPAAETLSGMDANAETYAKSKLGDNWRDTNPALVELLNGRRYAGFQTNVDRVAAETPAAAEDVAQQIIDADPTPKEARNQKSFKESYAEKDGASSALFENPNLTEAAQMADWLGSLTQAQWDKINPAFSNNLNPFKNPASIDYKADRAKLEAVLDAPAATAAPAPATTEPTTDIAAIFTQDLPSGVKLSANEQTVFETIQQAFANNEQDDIVQSDGKLNPQRIADRGGMKSRQAAQTALTRLRPKLAKGYGFSQEQIKQSLAEAKNKSTEAFDPNEAAAEVDLAELGKSMGTVASANQGARDGMAKEDRDFLGNMEETPNRVQTPEQRAAIRAEMEAEMRSDPAYKGARDTWNNGFETDIDNEADRINFDSLDAGTRFEFLARYSEFNRGGFDADQMGAYYDDIRAAYVEDTQNATAEIANEGRQIESGTNPEALTSDEGEVRSEGNDPAGTGPTTAAELQGRAANVRVETKKRKKIDPKKAKTNNPRFGVRDNATATASREAFEQSVNELTGDTQNIRIHVFDTEADALAAIENGDVPSADTDEIAKVQPYGWVQEDEKGVPHAHFILDRIPAGGERAAFMHEVGGHVGIDNVLDEASRTKLASQIADWAGANDGSLESKLALRTLRRMDLAAMRGGVSDGVVVSEAIAYFLEEATLAGVDPTAGDAVGNFVQRIYDAFKAAFEALGLKSADTLVAQDIVDMAYGAARFELMEGSLDPTTTTAPFQRPSYGVNPNRETRTEATRAYVKENLGDAAVKFLDDASFIARNAVDSTKFLHQFIRENKETMPSAGRWYNGMLEAEKTRNDIRRSVESIATQARDLAADRLDVVNDFIGSSTFYQKWGYDPEVEGKTVKVDPIMKRRFDKLDPKEQQLAKDIFAHGETMRLRKQEIAKKLGVQGKFFSDAALEGPYAPLKRFGNFVGQLKSQELLDAEAELRENRSAETRKRVDDLKANEDHYVISFFDTMGAAKQFADANREKFTFAVASERSPDMESDRVASPEVFDKILGQLRADDNSGIDSSAKTAFAEMVKKMYFQSLDERSARQSGARRMNRAGYEKNMLRSFLSHARAEAALVANMEHGAEINTAFAEANVEASQDEANLRSVYNMVAKHYRDTLVGKETPIQDRLAAMNSVYMLTTSVGYHVTNATQPMMVTIPRLAGDFKNYSGAWGALARGYKVSVKAAKMGKNLEADIDVSKAPPKYRKLLEDLQLRQLLDVGMEEDLSEFDRFNTGYEPLNRLGDKLGMVVHKLYQVARFVEAHNRISAAVAAYDMALANPETTRRLKMTPEEYATAVVEDTQGNFARFDSPYVIKALPKMTTQYRKYQLMMGWAYGNAFNQAFMDKSISAEEKAMGKRVLGYTLTHAGIFAGVTGVPLVTTLAPYVLGWIEGEDEPQDLERWIRENVENERLADVLSRGVFSAVGIDMSTKLSQGKIFHPFPYVDFEASEDGVRDIFFNALAGPSGTTALNFGRAAEYAGQGDLMKATEYAVPKGIRTMIESYRLGTEGFSAKNGDVLVDPREFDMQSLLLNALGIPSSDVQRFKWTRGQQFELSQYVSNESSRIRREYIQAKDDGDRARMTELRTEWHELQDQKDRIRPFFGNSREMQRQSVGDLVRAPRRQDRRERREQRRFE